MVSDYGSLSGFSDEEKAKIESICEGKTISEIRQIIEYFEKTVSDMRKVAENDLTMEDFERAKKEDVDSDNEEGESY